jgi:two-component system, OmpR family, sensor histidine kinase KdpD
VLRIYLGAAPGVGKTFAMLNEGWRRKQRGSDVVVGIVETHGRTNTAEQIRDLEVIPRTTFQYRGTAVAEMDLATLLKRRPDICLVDELAHTNAPGSRNTKRWQDINELLDAGIDVISTVNIQHLESLNDVVERITGATQRETVPDVVVRAADQIELVDMSPEALRRRMAHGNIYPPERIDVALANYFRAGNLGALRELALLWVADRVEESLQGYLEAHGIDEAWETRERVVVAVSGDRTSDALIRRAARMAGRRRGELIGVHVAPSDGLRNRGDQPQNLVESRNLVTELGGRYREIVADDKPRALVEFARAEHATQLVIGADPVRGWRERLLGSFARRVLAKNGMMDVHVIAVPSIHSRPRRRPRQTRPLQARREATALLMVAVGLPLLIALIRPFQDRIAVATSMLVMLVFVLAVSTVGGRRISIVAAFAAAIAENWFFVDPVGTLTIKEDQNVVALLVFVLVAVTVGTLVERAAQRTIEAGRARAEAEALARSSVTLASDPDAIHGLVEQIRMVFGLDGAAVLAGKPGAWITLAESGNKVPTRPEDGEAFRVDSSTDTPDHVLVVVGGNLSSDDRRVIEVLATQLTVGIESRRLGDEADAVHALTQVDAVRTALLRAVSHDLRSPLASIKTYVSGLLATDVSWSAEQVRETLSAIDGETDRLNRVVGNLLDASRLDAGMTAVSLCATDVHEVIAAAAQSFGTAVQLRVDESIGRAVADPALLERSIANVIGNAARFQPRDMPVLVDAAQFHDEIQVRVIDRGPGIPESDRAEVVKPFQRLGDHSATEGVGLGLAIASGFVDAMNGTFGFEDTPGGGLTVVIALPLHRDSVPPAKGAP